MPDTEPEKLADDLEREVGRMEQESRRLDGRVSAARDDWRRKRSDPQVPGAPPDETEDAGGADAGEDPESMAPQAPPENDAPAEAETAPEMAVGPPADDQDEDSSEA